MRTLLLSLTLLLAARGAAAQRPAAPPDSGRVGVLAVERDTAVVVYQVLPGTPGIAVGDRLLAVDGRPVRGLGNMVLDLTLELGSLELTVASPGGAPRTVRLERWELGGSAPRYPGRVVTPHFVVHHRDAPEEREYAQRVAREAEAAYARSGLPRETGGRRAHLYAGSPPGNSRSGQSHQVVWVSRRTLPKLAAGQVMGYVAFGRPGRLAERHLGAPWGGWGEPRDGAHRMAVEAALENGRSDPDPRAFLAVPPAGPSLREYVRGRWGDARLAALWRSDEDLDAAAPRALGIPSRQLLADWRRHVYSLGPRDGVGPRPGTFAMTLGWSALILLWGVRVARRKESA